MRLVRWPSASRTCQQMNAEYEACERARVIGDCAYERLAKTGRRYDATDDDGRRRSTSRLVGERD